MIKKYACIHPDQKEVQMSETLINAVFLTISGGFQDAYTYCLRGGVFANAQTGNIVLMSSSIFKGMPGQVLHYLVPLCAFAAGVFVAEAIRCRCGKALDANTHVRENPLKSVICYKKLHWRQLILLAEILMLFAVGFMPVQIDMAANATVSFVCAMQVQAFRKFNGNPYASTMCIGNIRNGTEALCTYFYTKNKNSLRKALEYFSIIITFAAGAGMGSILTTRYGIKSIWFSCLLLMISFCIMRTKRFRCVPDAL